MEVERPKCQNAEQCTEASALANARQTQQTPDSLCTHIWCSRRLGSQFAHRSPLFRISYSPLPLIVFSYSTAMPPYGALPLLLVLCQPATVELTDSLLNPQSALSIKESITSAATVTTAVSTPPFRFIYWKFLCTKRRVSLA